jgi:hypothetical protein
MGAIARNPTNEPVHNLTSRQFGLISRAQALELGLTTDAIRHFVDSGRWLRIHKGVYAVAGSPGGWYQSLLAGCLAGGDTTVASHGSAAALLELPDCRPGPIQLSSTRNIRRTEFTVHRVKSWLPADLTRVRGIPCTDSVRTVIDLSGVLPDDHLEIVFHDVLNRFVSLPRLAWRVNLEDVRQKTGIGTLKSWIDEIGPGGRAAESGFEVLLYRLLVNGRLPKPVRQYQVVVSGNERRIDLAYPDALLGIEAVGWKAHQGNQVVKRSRPEQRSAEPWVAFSSHNLGSLQA